MYSYNYDYSLPADTAGIMATLGVIWGIAVLLGLAISIAAYVMNSLAMYTIAKRRGIAKPWLAWIPVASVWITGSLSDQYQYLVKGKIKSRRKVLLGLSIGSCVAGILTVILSLVMVVHLAIVSDGVSDAAMMSQIGGTVIGLLAVFVGLLVTSIVMLVFQYMSLYDIYRSCDPKNAVAFLVVGLVGGVVLQMFGLPGVLLEPIFLLIVRKKDDGMPPRRNAAAPAETQPEEVLCIHDAEPESLPEQPPVEEPVQADKPEPWEI